VKDQNPQETEAAKKLIELALGRRGTGDLTTDHLIPVASEKQPTYCQGRRRDCRFAGSGNGFSTARSSLAWNPEVGEGAV